MWYENVTWKYWYVYVKKLKSPRDAVRGNSKILLEARNTRNGKISWIEFFWFLVWDCISKISWIEDFQFDTRFPPNAKRVINLNRLIIVFYISVESGWSIQVKLKLELGEIGYEDNVYVLTEIVNTWRKKKTRALKVRKIITGPVKFLNSNLLTSH